MVDLQAKPVVVVQLSKKFTGHNGTSNTSCCDWSSAGLSSCLMKSLILIWAAELIMTQPKGLLVQSHVPTCQQRHTNIIKLISH